MSNDKIKSLRPTPIVGDGKATSKRGHLYAEYMPGCDEAVDGWCCFIGIGELFVKGRQYVDYGCPPVPASEPSAREGS